MGISGIAHSIAAGPRWALRVATWLGLTVACVTNAHADVEVTAVMVDGREMPLPKPAEATGEPVPLRIPSTARQVQFRFRGERPAERRPETGGEATLAEPRAARLRFRLDGHDTAWRDAPASARAMLHFGDGTGALIGGDGTIMPGESAGWRGTPEASPFTRYELVATAPAGAAQVFAAFLTHNADQVVGCIGIDDIALQIGDPNQHGPPGESDSLHRLTPLRLDASATAPLTTPKGWERPGSRPEMSVVRRRSQPEPHAILAIEDDDPTRFGNWSMERHRPLAVAAGDTVRLSWTAAHSFGMGGQLTANYGQLRPGSYWFRVGAFLPGGGSTGVEASIPVVVVPPLWMRRDVWAAAVAAAAAGLGLAGRAIATRQLTRRLQELERSHALERERSRIARDLHDEIGAKLTEIAMRADTVRSEVDGIARPEVVQLAGGIWQIAADLVRSVDAIVWAVNPANDTLDRFAAYLVQSTEQFLDAAGIAMRFQIPEDLPPVPLDGTIRHSLFLAVREAENNAVKHSGCTTMTIALTLTDGLLEIVIADNGKGFDPHDPKATPDRSGLTNMRRRMEEIGGRFAIDTSIGRGTAVQLTLPLPAVLPPRGPSS
jgi:signal transduction histidine kinase